MREVVDMGSGMRYGVGRGTVELPRSPLGVVRWTVASWLDGPTTPTTRSRFSARRPRSTT